MDQGKSLLKNQKYIQKLFLDILLISVLLANICNTR